MGRPKSRRALSASRFQEGSMNDRTSAAPPVHFLGPEERAALERPALTNIKSNNSRPMSDDFSDKQVKRGRLLGQVWDERDNEEERGARKRSRSRKRDQSEQRGRQRERENGSRDGPAELKTAEDTPREDMPSREEILANYHNLMASGFFSSHAIQDALSRATTPQDGIPRAPNYDAPSPPKSPTKIKHLQKHHLGPDGPGAATYEELVASGFFTPPISDSAPPPTPIGAAPAPTTIFSRLDRPEDLEQQRPQLLVLLLLFDHLPAPPPEEQNAQQLTQTLRMKRRMHLVTLQPQRRSYVPNIPEKFAAYDEDAENTAPAIRSRY
ncbi:hypothetical protein LB503_005890 [Fusarium chuoi]|nr:hypothetical protein LB503_005890 [Fusarium chuoi]